MIDARRIVALGILAVTIVAAADAGSAPSPCTSTRLLADDGAAGDDFGAAVAIDGTLAVVGAPEDDDAGGSSGAAYVYRFDGTAWTQAQKLTASDAEGGDDYGFAVAVSGDTIVVGSPRDDTVAGSRAGSAWVYRFDGASFAEEDHLFAADAGADDRFGFSVAVDGDTILVGAIQHDDGAANAGAGYVFTRAGTTWTQQDELTAAAPMGTNPQMGRSVALDGDVAVLGAWQFAPPGMFSVGAAYVFRRSGVAWNEEQRLTASDAADFRWFGHAVAVNGRDIAVGAYGDQAGGLNESGGAYFYRFDGATWNEDANVNASDAAAGDRFGWSIALDAQTAAVGTGSSASKAYLFTRGDGSWPEAAMLDPADPDASTEYGFSVSLRGSRAVVGDRNGLSGNGLAFVFELAVDCCPEDCAEPTDGDVDVTDLLAVLAQWGGVGSCDVDDGGTVEVGDLLAVLAEWGPCP
jgi:hypothetical protein